jgi:hypothetical protein
LILGKKFNKNVYLLCNEHTLHFHFQIILVEKAYMKLCNCLIMDKHIILLAEKTKTMLYQHVVSTKELGIHENFKHRYMIWEEEGAFVEFGHIILPK